MDSRRKLGSGPAETVYVLPPGTENLILASLYDLPLVQPSIAKDPHDHISRLPVELKCKIARCVLVFPGKVRVSVSTSDNREFKNYDYPDLYFDMMQCTTYKFFLHVKVPRFLIPKGSSRGYHGYYWSLEKPATLLALLAVKKEFYEICKPIFYGENFFEVLDGQHAFLQDYGSVLGHEQLAHRFLELLSWARARDGTPRYGIRPLSLIHKINIDMELCEEGGGQSSWAFDRIISAIISIPHLNKLVINVRMSYLETIAEREVNIYVHPELWPGLRKLPWAASTIVADDKQSSLKLKLYIPENRRVEKWLQDLIDMPDHEPAKLADVTYED
jgi:hypothetical protein